MFPRAQNTKLRTCSPSNLEDLTGDQFAKIIGTLDTDAGGLQVAVTWIAKEMLRNAPQPARPHHQVHALRVGRPRASAPALPLVRPARRHPRTRLPRPDGTPLGGPDPLRELTGRSNAVNESYNRLAKLEARQALLRARTMTRTPTSGTGRNHKPGSLRRPCNPR